MPSLGTIWAELGLKITKFDEGLRQAEAKIKQAENSLEGLQNASERLSGIGQKMTLGITLPLLGIGTAAVKMAMDAVESENLFEVSMGNMAAAARQWSEEISRGLGLNEYEIRKVIGTFNVMLTSMGLGEQAAFDMAKGLTQLAYDMASFYNLKPEEAFQKLQAGITGEIEPLKRLGIVVNETTIQTYAYTHGIAEQGEKLTEQQKILARYGAIMDQTSKAQGDLARTIDSPTNRLRILSARVQEAAVDLGQLLMPAAEKLISKISDLVKWFQDLDPVTQKVIMTFAGMAATIGPLLWGFGQFFQVIVSVRAGIAVLSPLISGLAIKFGLAAPAAAAAAASTTAAGTASALATPAVAGLSVAVNSLIWPLTLVALAIGGFIALLKYANKAVGDTRNTVERSREHLEAMGETLEGDLDPKLQRFARDMDETGEKIETFSRNTADSVTTLRVRTAEEAEAFSHVSRQVQDEMDRNSDKAKTTAEKIQSTLSTAMERLDTNIEIVRTRLQLMASDLEPVQDKTEMLTATLKAQEDELALVNAKIAEISQAYESMRNLKGETATETQRLYLELLKEQQAQSDLKKQIEETNQELKKQAAIKAGRIWEAEGRPATDEEIRQYAAQTYIQQQIATGGTIDPSKIREVMGSEAIHEDPGDILRRALSVAEQLHRATGKIVDFSALVASMQQRPDASLDELRSAIGLASGGIVTKPIRALLGENGPEAVVPLDRSLLGQVTITITGNHIASDYDVDRIGEQLVRRLRMAGVIG